ncbi:MAG: SMP-30/gluconolactonase/LRE family protein [bacterium]
MSTPARQLVILVAVLLMLAAIGGCSTSLTTWARSGAEDETHPVWPPPGQKPRIVHRQDVYGPPDMGEPGLLDRLVEAIAGPSRQPLVQPQSIAVGNGRLFVVDQERQGIHVLKPGTNKGRFIDRVDRSTYFVSPVDVAWCDGMLAVSDSGLQAVFLLDPAGTLVAQLDKPNGFQRPTGLAFDAARDRLYVVDTRSHEINVFDLAENSGGAFVETIGNPGSLPGEFHYPTYAAVDGEGRLYVTDSLNFRVQALSPEGRFLFEIGKLGNASGHMAVPKGIGVDRFGHIYVVDSYFSAVQIFDRQGRLLLSFGEVGDRRGEFAVPTGLLVTADDLIYVCDTRNSRVQVFEYVGGPDHDH